jgi:hypothetical protein
MKKIELPNSLFYDLITLKLKTTISTSDLSSWLASKTDDQFIVIEKALLIDAFDSIEQCSSFTNEIKEGFKKKWGDYI